MSYTEIKVLGPNVKSLEGVVEDLNKAWNTLDMHFNWSEKYIASPGAHC
jgi:hypothetical protein